MLEAVVGGSAEDVLAAQKLQNKSMCGLWSCMLFVELMQALGVTSGEVRRSNCHARPLLLLLTACSPSTALWGWPDTWVGRC